MSVPDRITHAAFATASPDEGTASAPHTGDPPRHGLRECGRNCDTIRRAARFTMLVDGAAYFAALRARHTVFIVGGDVDSRMRLMPEGADDGLPDTLAAFLHALAAARHNLRIYVLAWDFAMIYALERDWPPVYRAAWRAHRGIRFRLDDTHPRGASHHQKLVVIDDRLAFVGGLDLTRARRDTSAHAADDPRRRDAQGIAPGPFHDAQAMFDGDAAAAIGEQARARWLNACGRPIAIRAQRHLDRDADPGPWLPAVRVDVRDVQLGIAYTAPRHRDREPVRHVHALVEDAIRAAAPVHRERDATGMHAVAGPTIDTPERRYGNAVLSRCPVRAARLMRTSTAARARSASSRRISGCPPTNAARRCSGCLPRSTPARCR